MPDTPVTFTYNGKQYTGILSPVNGANGQTWHLMIRNYYCGTLLIHPDGHFVFYSQQGYHPELALVFGEVVSQNK